MSLKDPEPLHPPKAVRQPKKAPCEAARSEKLGFRVSGLGLITGPRILIRL